jgi:hypothetical protein
VSAVCQGDATTSPASTYPWRSATVSHERLHASPMFDGFPNPRRRQDLRVDTDQLASGVDGRARTAIEAVERKLFLVLPVRPLGSRRQGRELTGCNQGQ